MGPDADAHAIFLIITCSSPNAFVLRAAVHTLFYISSQSKKAHIFIDDQCIVQMFLLYIQCFCELKLHIVMSEADRA